MASLCSTRFLDVEAMSGLIGAVGIRAFIREMFENMRADFSRWESFERSARVASHSAHGVIELMPTSDGELYAFKYVNGHPLNPGAGFPTVMAYGALADVATGFPTLLCEMTILTAVRTAVASALAASVLARKDSRTMALIGNGAQAEFQILAFSEICGVNRFQLFDVDAEATKKVIRNLAGYPELALEGCASIQAAIQGADIITTATASKLHANILSAEDIRPGTHVNGIGGDCPGKTEIDAGILTTARLVVEYEPQSRVEGEIQQLATDCKVTELWQIVAGRAPGRISDEEVTVFDSVGFSIEDFSALRTVLKLSEARGFGESIHLVPNLLNVKDLFSLLLPKVG